LTTDKGENKVFGRNFTEEVQGQVVTANNIFGADI